MQAWRQTADQVLAALASDAKSGLSSEEARARLGREGKNELRGEEPPPAWKRFAAQFRDVLVVLLLVATAISTAIWLTKRESPLPYDALVILAIVLANAALGTFQEIRAASAVAALRRMSAAKARVVRDGERKSIAAAEVVPGDVLLVEEGDTVPADARLLHAAALQANESALTGESLPVEKDPRPLAEDAPLADRQDMLWSGTTVSSGRGRAVVVATGMRTEMGRIAGLLKGARAERTPLQGELDRVGKALGIVVSVIAAVMVAAIVAVQHVRGVPALFDVLLVGVALAVAAVPEGLPAVVTAVLSLGVQRAARRNAIVRQLSAVETLGSANVIASDKTGTLTKNEMTVRVVVTASGRVRFGGSGYAPEGEVVHEDGGPVEGALGAELRRTLAAAERANDAVLMETGGRWAVQGDPTEGALVVAARKAGLRPEALDARFARLAEVPFSSERKLMSTVHGDAERRERVVTFTKGAPEVLLSRCTSEQRGDETGPLTRERRATLARTSEELAAKALRTLAIAYRSWPRAAFDAEEVDESVETDLVLLGLVGMMDPPREEAREAVERARAAGIRSLLITGDHPVTAAVIARELGISEAARAVTGAEIEKLDDAALDETVRERSVYARVDPEHKLRIVKALKRAGCVVAMTGDGVNDAPALDAADIGIAMGRGGTDVSREAADIVLADDNFATIVAAVEEGRAIYANIRKFLLYLISTNIGEVMTMLLGVVFAGTIGLPEGALPLLATQLLWVNLVTDGAPALALGVDPPSPNLMASPPRPRSEGVITRGMWARIFLAGTVVAAGTLLALRAGLPLGVRHAQTMAFTTVVFFSLFQVFNARSGRRSVMSGLFSNRWLWGAVASSLLLQVAVVHVPFLQRAFSTVPLRAGDWLLCAAVASSVLWLSELRKALASFVRRDG